MRRVLDSMLRANPNDLDRTESASGHRVRYAAHHIFLCLERLQESQVMNEIISREHPQYRLIRHHGKLGDAISTHLLQCRRQLCIRSDRLHLCRRYHGFESSRGWPLGARHLSDDW